jgi:hypothetical protein
MILLTSGMAPHHPSNWLACPADAAFSVTAASKSGRWVANMTSATL